MLARWICGKLSIVAAQREEYSMRSINGYVLAAAMGAIGGGLFVALATKAIPE